MVLPNDCLSVDSKRHGCMCGQRVHGLSYKSGLLK